MSRKWKSKECPAYPGAFSLVPKPWNTKWWRDFISAVSFPLTVSPPSFLSSGVFSTLAYSPFFLTRCSHLFTISAATGFSWWAGMDFLGTLQRLLSPAVCSLLQAQLSYLYITSWKPAFCSPILKEAWINLIFPITRGYDLGISSNYFLTTWFVSQWWGVGANRAAGLVNQHPNIMQNRVRFQSRQMLINQYHLSAKH